MRRDRNLAVLFACTLFGWAGSARAQWPASVVGSWSGISDQATVLLTITSQANGNCGFIAGTMQVTAGGKSDAIDGFYCPASGRIGFVRTQNGFLKFYSGNTSTDGSAPFIAGNFAQEQSGSGAPPLTEWTFYVQKQ